jgi:hypothetical protein
MKKGLRKILIGSAALFLLIALVAPGISASTAPNTSAGIYSTASSGSSYVPPSTQPLASSTDPMSQPDGEAEPALEDEPEPAPDGEAEPQSEPEEILPEIPSMDPNPDEPDSSYPAFYKVRGKSASNRHGDSGNPKKVK